MAKNFRGTIFFKDREYGWSETFFKQGEDYAPIATALKTLAFRRIKLCGGGIRVPYIRVSDEAVKRDSYVIQTGFVVSGKGVEVVDQPVQIDPNLLISQDQDGAFALPPGKPLAKIIKANEAFDNADQPYSAILLRLEGGPQSWRQLYMRGVPDNVIINPDGPNLLPEWLKSFKDWKATLFTDGWGMYGLDRSPANPVKAIGNVVGAANQDVVVTATAHGVLAGEQIRISGVKPDSRVNGLWTASVTDANTLTLRNSASATPLAYDRGGTVLPQRKAIQAFTRVILRGETHRDTGRPFDSPRGRRRRKA